MLKIGVIGLGDIAQKAYLPVLCNRELELHLYTRDLEKLFRIGREYRFQNLHQSFESILNSGIQAAFVHTSTGSHVEIVQMLLMHNIHVYVDKPVTYDYASTKRLLELAESKNLLLMVGFNRRYAPAYRELKQVVNPNMIIMQKNRVSLPGDVRTFIFDDFIHVIDTLCYLFPYPVKELTVKGQKKGNLLYHVVVQMIADNGAIAMGIMNRDAGLVEERVEVFSSGEKRSVVNLSSLSVHVHRDETNKAMGDWDSMLYKRGFEQIIGDFLQAVRAGGKPQFAIGDWLRTHEICEEVVLRLNK
ncbi:Gfo/Idh/MocA family protein [Daejeonella lutea]|uniref:Virulence factor n=1 Tax=Daejeonella lutea TaxID=572036 RepID=A0A1T4ZX46_9SPHI|nr:Gfo/Idh/MocA family oxidoreductase [Daejeonella lutea]SKB27262.1 virulence factor [Daejeonella lutea]